MLFFQLQSSTDPNSLNVCRFTKQLIHIYSLQKLKVSAKSAEIIKNSLYLVPLNSFGIFAMVHEKAS